MEKPQEKFMQLAINEAHKGIESANGGPFGVVIVKGTEVLSSAHNTVIKDNDPTHHAEVNAISLATSLVGTYDLSGCEIYSTTEPCPMCFSAVHWARIDRIIYGTSIEDVKKLGFNELTVSCGDMQKIGGSRLEIISNFMVEECEALLEYWNGLPDKMIY